MNNYCCIVIGADGFIGSYIKKFLIQSGRNVLGTVYNRKPEENSEIFLDMTNKKSFEVLPEGIPVINASGTVDQSLPASVIYRINTGGVKNIVEWAQKADVPHLVHLSSVGVYGNSVTGENITEDTPIRTHWPLSPFPYGRSKARAEKILQKSGVPYTALRLPAVYGINDSFFTKELKKLFDKMEKKPFPPAGKKLVSLMPVDFMGPLCLKILEANASDRSFNAAGIHVPWKTIVETFAEYLGITIKYAEKIKLSDYTAFSDPGLQMAVYYSSRGAHFPDDRLRDFLNWHERPEWTKTLKEAAVSLKHK